MATKQAKRGRPFAPEGTKATARVICRLTPADKELLVAHAKAGKESESAVLRRGLVVLGVLSELSGTE